MTEIKLRPIGIVENTRSEVEDDNWGGVVSKIVLSDEFGEESLRGIEEFSHVEVIYSFHQADAQKVVAGARHPRNNTRWPKVGIFAQRGKNRPNHLGLTVAKVLKCEGKILYVKGLDAINGTPVLDIKPVMKEFLPEGTVRQPKWVSELMGQYWNND